MKFTHPEGTHTIIAVPGTMLLAEVVHDPVGKWLTIGYIGHPDKIMLHDADDWEAFKQLIAEIDEALK